MTQSFRYRVIALVVILLPAVALLSSHADLPSLGRYGDDGIYLVTAKAIAEGKGYRIESLPDERWETKYPPAYPLMLAAVWRLFPHFPENASKLLIVSWLALPLSLVLSMRMLAGLGFSLSEQALVCLAILAHDGDLLLSLALMPDFWFLCEVLLVIWLAERASEPGSHWRTAIATGLAASAAYLTRSAGIVLLVSVIGVLLYQRRWRHALSFCSVLIPVIAIWTAWAVSHQHGGTDFNDIFYSSYSSYFREFTSTTPLQLLSRMPIRTDKYLLALGSRLVPEFLSGTIFDWLRRLLVVVGIAGVWRMVRAGKASHYAAFAVLYAAEICTWPSSPFTRYVLPLIPLWLAGLMALPRNWRAAGRLHLAAIPVWQPLVLGGLTFLYLVNCFAAMHGAAIWRGQKLDYERAYTWIASSVPPDASVVAFRDPILYLYAHRHAEGLFVGPRDDAASRISNIAGFARGRGHRYVLFGPDDPAFNPPELKGPTLDALGGDPGTQLVYSKGGVYVYDVMAPAERSSFP